MFLGFGLGGSRVLRVTSSVNFESLLSSCRPIYTGLVLFFHVCFGSSRDVV